jgi:hypothetical protein
MISLGALTFAVPLALIALAALPVLWWLLRAVPPSPQRVTFPPLRLLAGLLAQEETPAHTPWWLLLLRIIAAALLIIGIAHPVWNLANRLAGNGPLILAVDNGWTAADGWDRKLETMLGLIDEAERTDRPVAVLPSIPPVEPVAGSSGLMTADAARRVVGGLKPQPWRSGRNGLTEQIEALSFSGSANAVWISDGIASEDSEAFATRLQQTGSLRVFTDIAENGPLMLLPPRLDGTDVEVSVRRATTNGERTVVLRAVDDEGRGIGLQTALFGDGDDVATARITLPTDLRNRLARVEIQGRQSAGSVALTDDRWRRRPVGLIQTSATDTQPLLGARYYLRKALEPFSEIREGDFEGLIESKLSVLILPDYAGLTETDQQTLDDWIRAGGVMIRFAGPALARQPDSLLPVQLRSGGRSLGGTMSWSRPTGLAPFPANSPFAGLPVTGDVKIRRQVLAEPSLELPQKTWATLVDGTPLVTAERRDDGLLVLFHVTSNSEWSDLPLSGLFVDMLRRVVSESRGVLTDTGRQILPPIATFDGFGLLGTPPANVLPVEVGPDSAPVTGPRNPPGLYGADGATLALNEGSMEASFAAISAYPGGAVVESYGASEEVDFQPALLLAAALLLLADFVISLGLRGLLRPALGAMVIVTALGLSVIPEPARAQDSAGQPKDDRFALEASLQTRLAAMDTGIPASNRVAVEGLTGLSVALNRRSATDLGEPVLVDPERDELGFFPLIYWRVERQQRPLSDFAIGKLNDFLKNGGMLLIDQALGDGLGGSSLAQLLRGLNVPPLEPVQEGHVLTRSFYLLDDFPGRWAGNQVWVEREASVSNDGVSSVVIGVNDWGAAWAVDDAGRPLYAVSPGGDVQRELAYRFGVNLVMYALTGNYKADQVHVPAIMERLGQ